MQYSSRLAGFFLFVGSTTLGASSTHAVVVQRPTVTVNIPKPVINVPRPTIPTIAKPVINVPKPVVNVPKPVVNVPKPVVNVPKPTPVVNVPKPVVDTPKPTAGVGKPALGIHRPVPREGNPKNGITTPVVAGGDTKPVLNQPAGVVPKPVSGDRPTPEGITPKAGLGVAVQGGGTTGPKTGSSPQGGSTAGGPLKNSSAASTTPSGSSSGSKSTVISREDASKILTVVPANAPKLGLAAASTQAKTSEKAGASSGQSKATDGNMSVASDPKKDATQSKLKSTSVARAAFAADNAEGQSGGSSSGGGSAFSDYYYCKANNCTGTNPLNNSSGSSQMGGSSTGGTKANQSAVNAITAAGGTVSQTSNSVTVKLANGSYGTATVNSDGTMTVGNNYGSVRLTQQQMQQVANGDMSPVAALMGNSSASAGGRAGGTSAQPTQSSFSASDIFNSTRNATRVGLAAEKLLQEGVKYAGKDYVPYGTPNPYVPYDVQPYAPNDISIKPNAFLDKLGKVAKVASGVLGTIQAGEGVFRTGDSTMTRSINFIEGTGKVAGAFSVPGSGYAAVTGEGLRTIQAWNAGDRLGAAEHASAFVARTALGAAFALEAGTIALFTGPAGAGLAAQKGFDAGSSTAGAAITLGNAVVGAAIDYHFSNSP